MKKLRAVRLELGADDVEDGVWTTLALQHYLETKRIYSFLY